MNPLRCLGVTAIVSLQLALMGGVSAQATADPVAPLATAPACTTSYATKSGSHYLEVYAKCATNTFEGKPYVMRAVAYCKRSNGTTFNAYSPYFTPTTGVYATCSTNGSAWAIQKGFDWYWT